MNDGHDYRSEVDRIRELQAQVDGLSERLAKAWEERDAALAARDEARRELTNAEADARILAHAYENDNRPPPDVVARAHAYRAGRPTT